MFFSIIVPVYKVEKYINECVDSILSQTFSDFEIILVDDGSPDNCGKMCDEYALKDDRIKVIHKENGGLSDARNKGMEIAKGEYVLFLDSDDKLFDDFVLKNIFDKLMEKDNPDLFLTCESNFKDGLVLDGKTYLKKWLQKGQKKDIYDVTVWNKVYKRKYLVDSELVFLKGYVHEDDNFTPKAIANAKSCFGDDLNICFHRENDKSITKTKNEKSYFNRSISKMHMAFDTIKYFEKFVCDEELKNLTIEYALKMFFSGVSIGTVVKDKKLKKGIKDKINECNEIFDYASKGNIKSHKVLSIVYKFFGVSGFLFFIKIFK